MEGEEKRCLGSPPQYWEGVRRHEREDPWTYESLYVPISPDPVPDLLLQVLVDDDPQGCRRDGTVSGDTRRLFRRTLTSVTTITNSRGLGVECPHVRTLGRGSGRRVPVRKIEITGMDWWWGLE